MKRMWLLGGVVAVAGVLVSVANWVEPVHAQAQAQSRGLNIAVIDVDKVIREYTKFKSLMDGLKNDVESKQNELIAQEQLRQGKMKQLAALKEPKDRDKIEKEIADLEFAMEKVKRSARGDFAMKEADIFMTVYNEMTDLLGRYCEENHIHMVLRLVETPKETNPNTVLPTVYRSVVYSHKNLDLTEVILEGMNQRIAMQQKPAAR